jgi:hypothetical protein
MTGLWFSSIDWIRTYFFRMFLEKEHIVTVKRLPMQVS